MRYTPPSAALTWPIDYADVCAMALDEGLRLVAYQCQAGIWTLGRGETAGITQGMTCTVAQADLWLLHGLEERTREVLAMCTRAPNPHELAALVRLSYNIGLRDDKRKAGLYHSRVLRLHNAGDQAGAARAFALLNKYRDPKTGQLTVSRGLTARRAAEAARYLQPVDADAHAAEPIPQAVAPESRLPASPIAQAGTVTAAVGVLGALQDAAGTAQQAGSAVQQITQPVHGALDALRALATATGVPPSAALWVLLIAAGGACIYWRWRQRHEGWA